MDRPIRSFVKRSGRITKSQQSAMEQYAPDFMVTLPEPTQSLLSLPTLFLRDAPCILEIGFGNGDSLCQMAQQQPEKNFLGAEVYDAGVGRLLNNVVTHTLHNVRIFHGDVLDLLPFLADGSLAGIQLFFPDPWHKTKHHKRRLVQTPFLEAILPKLMSGGFIHMATDWQAYAEQMLVELQARTELENTAQTYVVRPEHRPLTKFERRGERLGHGVWDLIFKKISSL